MRKFWIDCDIGVDDAVAILMMLGDPDVDVIGISAVAGNSPVNNVTRNALRLLTVAGRLQVPVYQGADRSLLGRISGSQFHGADGMGDLADPPQVDLGLIRPEHAVTAMTNAIKAHSGDLNLVMLGPLTNLALVLRLDPSVRQQISHCYVMGGNHSGEGNETIGAEFNFHCDPEAAHVVLNELESPMTIITWETCLKTGIPFEFVDQLDALGTKRSELFREMSQRGRRFCAEVARVSDIPEYQYYFLADTVAAAVALDPGMVRKSKQRRVKMELSGAETRGQMIVDWRGRFLTDTPKRNLVLGLHMDRYLALVRKALE